MDLGEAAHVHVRVDLRRADVRMAQHLLNGADVRAVLEQVRREAVAEDVRRDAVRRDADGGGALSCSSRVPKLPHSGQRPRNPGLW